MVTKIVFLVCALLAFPRLGSAQQTHAEDPEKGQIQFRAAPPLTTFAEMVARERAKAAAKKAQERSEEPSVPSVEKPEPVRAPTLRIDGINPGGSTLIQIPKPNESPPPPPAPPPENNYLWDGAVVTLVLSWAGFLYWLRRRRQDAPMRREMEAYAEFFVLPEFHCNFRHIPEKRVRWDAKCFPRKEKFEFWLKDPGRHFSSPSNEADVVHKLARIAAKHPNRRFNEAGWKYRRGWLVIIFIQVPRTEFPEPECV